MTNSRRVWSGWWMVGVALLLASSGCAEPQETDVPRLDGPYLGQTPPGTRAELFAPGVVSTPSPSSEDIWVMDRVGDGWGEPYNMGPPVNSDAPEFFPSLTHDGTIYFTRGVEGS